MSTHSTHRGCEKCRKKAQQARLEEELNKDIEKYMSDSKYKGGKVSKVKDIRHHVKAKPLVVDEGKIKVNYTPTTTNNHHVLNRHTVDRQAAIIMMTSDDDITRSKVYFNLGVTSINNQHFSVNGDVSSLKFKVSGLYQIQFEGVVTASSIGSNSSVGKSGVINLRFNRTPELDVDRLPFSKFELSPGEISKSTILPFNKGDSLEVLLKSANGNQVAIGKSSRLIVVRVDDL